MIILQTFAPFCNQPFCALFTHDVAYVPQFFSQILSTYCLKLGQAHLALGSADRAVAALKRALSISEAHLSGGTDERMVRIVPNLMHLKVTCGDALLLDLQRRLSSLIVHVLYFPAC